MYFDGGSSKEDYGASILLISPVDEVITLMYKLEFEATNNIVEYETLILGLRVDKNMHMGDEFTLPIIQKITKEGCEG